MIEQNRNNIKVNQGNQCKHNRIEYSIEESEMKFPKKKFMCFMATKATRFQDAGILYNKFENFTYNGIVTWTTSFRLCNTSLSSQGGILPT